MHALTFLYVQTCLGCLAAPLQLRARLVHRGLQYMPCLLRAKPITRRICDLTDCETIKLARRANRVRAHVMEY